MRQRTGFLIVVVALVVTPGAARAAAPVSLPVPRAYALTYAAGRMLWVPPVKHGPIVVMQVPVTGGAPSVLATIPRLRVRSDGVDVSLSANETGFLVAAREVHYIETSGSGYDVSRGELAVRGGYDGALHTVLRCRPRPTPYNDEEAALEIAAGPTGFALAGARCGTKTSVEAIGADGTVTPVAGVTLETHPVGDGYGLSYSEPFLAVDGGVTGPANATSVHVFDTAHATRRDLPSAKETEGGRFQVLPDGTLLIGAGYWNVGPSTIYRWTPDAPAPQPIPGVDVGQSDEFVAAGGRLLFDQFGQVAGQLALPMVGFDGTGLRAIGAPGAGRNRVPITFDGTTAAFFSSTCTGAQQVTVVDVTDTTPPSGPLGCPVSILTTTVSFARSGRGTISVSCPNSCRTNLQLYVDANDHRISKRELHRYVDKVHDPLLATGKLRLAPGATAQRVRLTLVGPALRLLRRHPQVTIFARLGQRAFRGYVDYTPARGPELTDPISLTAQLG